jgi:hypothetical protein
MRHGQRVQRRTGGPEQSLVLVEERRPERPSARTSRAGCGGMPQVGEDAVHAALIAPTW